MADQFSKASEAATIGQKLIKQYHEHLATRRVEFLFVERLDKDGKSQAIVKKGKNHLAHAKLVTGLNAYLATDEADDAAPLFVIVITKPLLGWQHERMERSAHRPRAVSLPLRFRAR